MTLTFKIALHGCLLTLSSLSALSLNPFSPTPVASAQEAASALPPIIEALPSAVAGDFIVHFEGLPAGLRLFEVALESGVSGTGTGEVPLNFLATDRVYVRATRRAQEGDSNRAMIYNGECGGDAESCSGKNDGDHLFQPGEGNLLIVSQNNDPSNPDDNFRGGQLYFDFSAFGPGTVTLTSLEVINIVREGASVELYADGERLKKISIEPSGEVGALSLVEINTSGVELMHVTARDQFAVNDLSFRTP